MNEENISFGLFCEYINIEYMNIKGSFEDGRL